MEAEEARAARKRERGYNAYSGYDNRADLVITVSLSLGATSSSTPHESRAKYHSRCCAGDEGFKKNKERD